MTWKSAVNRVLSGATGFQLVRADHADHAAPPAPPEPAKPARTKRRPQEPKQLQITSRTTDEVRGPARAGDRLLEKPVFVLSPVRSGSTLLRLVLNAHPMLHAPHELHVRRLRVVPTTALASKAMEMLGHDEADLEHLLWDRVLHRELTLSGKRYVVDKTPSNTFVHERIATAWPDARFIFLLRHPASIAASWADASTGRRTTDEAVVDALRYMRATEKARNNLSGLTIRYEDLTAEPEKVTREICAFLDIPWDPGMLEYGGDAQLVKGVGDWSDKVRTGSVQPGRAVPTDIHEKLVPISQKWGYLPGPEATGS